jgi:hypothetical protein
VGGGAAFFFILGLMRAAFYEGENSWVSSPILWTIWNSFFFACAILVATMLPTKAQWKERTHYLDINKRYGRLEAAKRDIEGKIEAINQAFADLAAQITELEVYRSELIKYIEAQRELIHAKALKEYHIKGGHNFRPRLTGTVNS